jgi:hypothetical protein
VKVQILKENSRANNELVKNWVGDDSGKLKQLMQLFLNDEYRVVQRAAGMISLIAEDHPLMIQSWLPQMIEKASQTSASAAIKRNVVRLMQFMKIPIDIQGEAMNLCFRLLADPKETVAVQCFSMTVLFNLSKTYPEIRPELKMIIEDHLQHQVTAGFLARAQKILACLK